MPKRTTTPTTAADRHASRGLTSHQHADRLAPGEAPPAWVPLSAAAERVSLCERTLRRAISAAEVAAAPGESDGFACRSIRMSEELQYY